MVNLLAGFSFAAYIPGRILSSIDETLRHFTLHSILEMVPIPGCPTLQASTTAFRSRQNMSSDLQVSYAAVAGCGT